jgi:myosin heavy subunit
MLVPSADWFTMIQNLELQKLCSLILEKTINDPDKYQNGLTKIFFRAGMLAALESLRSERLNALVVIIQKNMRRRMAQKKYQAMRQAAIKIQTWWRVIMARAFVEGVRKTTAAIKLQTAIRRYVQRRNFKTISASVPASRVVSITSPSFSHPVSHSPQASAVYRPDSFSEQIVATSQLCASRASSVVCECGASCITPPPLRPLP